MQLAVIVFPKSKNRKLAVLDKQGDGARVFLLDWPAQVVLLAVFLLASFGIWNFMASARKTDASVEVVRVPRAMQVLHIQHDALLKVGDTVFFRGNVAPGAGRIAGLPREGVKAREGASEHFMVLGPTRYYVVGADGVGQILSRADIRGIVQTRS